MPFVLLQRRPTILDGVYIVVTNKKNCPNIHSGIKEELLKAGVGIQWNLTGIGQSTDGAGEQTILKGAKTRDRISSFTTKERTYEKRI